jgi:hypothetical protein
MPTFLFQAKRADNDEPIKAEIYLGGKDRGFTQLGRDSWLEVKLSTSGRYEWYAKYHGVKIDSGSSEGGKITIYYSPK